MRQLSCNMMSLFKNTYLFAITFFVTLFIDILIKVNLGYSYHRYISKSVLIILLLVYYLINQKEVNNRKKVYMLLAFFSFLAGDILMLLYTDQLLYMVGISCFILGKMFYAFRFSNKKDFDFFKLLPFVILIFTYMVGLLFLMLNNLDSYFYVILVYLFMALTVVIFALLRKSVVNKKSYYLVLLGILFSVFSDSITGLQSFYNSDIAYHKVTIMLFYGLSQYFIVHGIVKETNFETIYE